MGEELACDNGLAATKHLCSNAVEKDLIYLTLVDSKLKPFVETQARKKNYRYTRT